MSGAVAGVLIATAGTGGIVGSATPTMSRTTANFSEFDRCAAFSAVYPTIPTGYSAENLYWHWTWVDADGAHHEEGACRMIKVKSDGSANYLVNLNLCIEDGATGNILNADGTVMSAGSKSGRVVLTVTDNSALEVFAVTKTGAAIVAASGTNVYYANESSGNDSYNGLSATFTGGFTGPKASLVGVLTTYGTNNRYWKINSGTYSMPSGVPAQGRQNVGVVAAPGQAVTLNYVSGGYRWLGGTNPLNQHVLHGCTLQSPSYFSDSRIFDSDTTAGTAQDITIASVVSTGTAHTIDNARNDGLYVYGNNTASTQYLYYAAARSEHVHFVANTHTTVLQSGVDEEAMFRFYNHRYSSWVENTLNYNGTEKGILRMIVQEDLGANAQWLEDGISTSSFIVLRDNTFTNVQQASAFNALSFSWDQNGSSRWRYLWIEGNSAPVACGATGTVMHMAPENPNIFSVVYRNNRMGADFGSGLLGGKIAAFTLTGAPEAYVRDRIIIEHNDMVALPYYADWSGTKYITVLSLPLSTGTTNSRMRANLMLFNSYTGGGDALLTFNNGVSTVVPGKWNPSYNVYLKTDTNGSSASSMTVFEYDEGTPNFRNRTDWLATGLDPNSIGLDSTDANMRSTIYDMTNYRVRSTASFVGGVPRSPSCRYDYLGNVRAANTTQGRYDPNGTANPFA